MFIVKIYNFETCSWDVMDFWDFPNDGNKKKAIFTSKTKAEYLRSIAKILSGRHIKIKVVTEIIKRDKK